MDAHGRRHAGDIDPADQWVFNPDTGSYELRLTPAHDGPQNQGPYESGHHSAPPRRRRASPEPATESEDSGTDRHSEPSGRRAAGRQNPTDQTPGQRGARSGGGRRRAGGQSASDSGSGRGSGDPPSASASGAGSGGHGRRKAKKKVSGKQKVLRWGGGSVALLMVAGCAGGYLYYQHLNNNIDKVDVGIDNPAVSDGPVNILLIGTDDRTGKGNESYGDKGSVGHADTTLLFHVSADRSNATVMSIPRDMITDIPTCPTKQDDGSVKDIPAEQNVRFNTSLGQRGRDPGCTWRTVQKITGVEINHFMMADFNAVKELSSAVGGVEVCVAKDIDDPKSHLKLKAGKHTIEGEQALAFVRTRHSVGFGSDLSRIELQQQFLSSMIRKMKSGGTLTNPKKLFNLAESATKALTVDTGIGTINKLIALGKDLRRVNTEKITFVTAPVLDNPADKSSVILDKSKSTPLFKMLQQDKSLTETVKKQKDAEKAGKKVKPAPASEVRVDILNGGGPVGAAQSTVSWLQNSKGVPLSTNAGNAPEDLSKTRLEFAPNQAGQAAALAKMMGLPGSALKKSGGDAGPDEAMKLTLGKDFTGAGEPISAPDKAPEGVKEVNASDKNLCAK
ncbi:LCP family protein [Streptomyces sp. N2-109]|uniref:LCP family protein n=1 Tax=Streptomyces gossypii TaxID=2883101 RepID=A0ABT2K0C4_9ACTN|nr:LCP family protein [Streptomyces gossypii]MCT2593617.1 LCP family protein [Streptomyces gossypii]